MRVRRFCARLWLHKGAVFCREKLWSAGCEGTTLHTYSDSICDTSQE